MKAKTRLSILFLVLMGMFIIVPGVSAHPLGNFTINHFAKVQVAPHQIRVDTVLDMAEIPAFQEISLLDKDQNGKTDPVELAGYPDRQCRAQLGQLILQQNGSSVPLNLAHAAVSFPPGAGGLPTLRLTCAFQNDTIQVKQNDRLDFQDQSYSDRIGWREIVVTSAGVHLSGQFATQSISQELTVYPQDLLSSPLDIRQVSMQVDLGNGTNNPATGMTASQKTAALSIAGRSDRFTELITLQDLSPAGIALALLIALLWGGLHSLTPGHGKTIVGAYLVGSRGTARHAVYLGLVTTATHTAGVFLLGLITYFASRYIVPEQLFPWISVLSGFLVVIIGVSLFIGRLRKARIWPGLFQKAEKTIPIGNQPIEQKFLPTGIHSMLKSRPASSPDMPALVLQPSFHALDRPLIWRTPPNNPPHPHSHSHPDLEPHHHEDGTDHDHYHPHTHKEGLDHEHIYPHLPKDGTAHVHEHGSDAHSHAFGGHSHSHLPPGSNGEKVSMRSLLMLGISGGLLPCPSALVVLLGAIALNRIGFGIILVLAFSLGLAGVLTGIGLMLVYARRFFDRMPVHSRIVEWIPSGSALFITLIGIGITIQALAQVGYR